MGSLLRAPQGHRQGTVGLCSYLEALGQNPVPSSSSWQELVLCACRTEDLAVLLGAEQRSFLLPRVQSEPCQ